MATTRNLLWASWVLGAAAAGAAAQQTIAEFGFEEGSFFGVWGESSATVLDSSGLQNHGFLVDAERRVAYTNDCYSGNWALDFNNPADTHLYPGNVSLSHTDMVEPAEGLVEARIKLDHYHAAILVTKSTFQWLRQEAGPQPPVFDLNGQPRIVGRSAYHLALTADGHVQALIGNDGSFATPGNGGGPWTFAYSPGVLKLNQWNHVAMRWNGCELAVFLNGQWSAPMYYEAVPGAGLSYRGTGVDPTYGPVDLDVSLVSTGSPFIGQMDDLRFVDLGARGPVQYDPGIQQSMKLP